MAKKKLLSKFISPRPELEGNMAYRVVKVLFIMGVVGVTALTVFTFFTSYPRSEIHYNYELNEYSEKEVGSWDSAATFCFWVFMLGTYGLLLIRAVILYIFFGKRNKEEK